MNEPRKTSARAGGGCLVALLAIVFFLLLGLLFVASQKGSRDKPEGELSLLYAIPASVSLRIAPQSGANAVALLGRGEATELIESQGVWVRVRGMDGRSGWAERSQFEGSVEHERRRSRADAIRRLPTLRGRVEKRAALHAGPGPFYPVVAEVDANTGVVVYTRDHDYYAIEWAGDIAYADVEAIDVASEGTVQLDVAELEPEIPDDEPPEMPAAPVERAPMDLQVPVVSPEERPSLSGVYNAVPAGGTQPVVIDQIKPRYPLAARRAATEGAVVVRAIVRKDGTPDHVEVIRDLPQGLGTAARDAVRRWRFKPATYRGKPIDVYYTVTVNFRLH